MIWIVGNNISINTFPKGFFMNRLSIGINHAAIMHKTQMAFSPYPREIKMFLRQGVPFENIIGVRPSTKIAAQTGRDDWPNEYPGLINEPILYNNHTRIALNEIEPEIKHLMTTKDKNYAYHNNGTSMQLLLFWCVLHDKTPIHVCGCNQTPACALGSCENSCDQCGLLKNDPTALAEWEISRNYTAEVIRCLNLYGDIVRFHVNYEDYLAKEKSDAKV